MFDHVGMKVSDLGASLAFYREALQPLGCNDVVFVMDPWGNHIEAVDLKEEA